MGRVSKLKSKHVVTMPPNVEEGILYISKDFGLAIHLCACGCGKKSVTPLERNGSGWTLTEDGDKATLKPSIGNWRWERPHHAHYYITDGKIVWC